MDARGALNPKLKQLKAELDSLKAQAAANEPPAGSKA